MQDIALTGTPYLIDTKRALGVGRVLSDLDERVELLRSSGRLSVKSLELFYGRTRFEQIAESNALEGSTLSAGDTELAVMKGITLTGHDPGYSRDARTLARALDRLIELARDPGMTGIGTVKEIHELVLGERPSAGHIRTEPVQISGSKHRPPRTWREVMTQMEAWDAWSRDNPGAHPVLRATVLHEWLTHVHPFIDGNGRTSRAVGNLELIRAGYPSIIIRARKDRSRYLEALASSDEGDLWLFFDLITERIQDALRDIERAALLGQGYRPQELKIRRAQENQLTIWLAATELLAEQCRAALFDRVEAINGRMELRKYAESLALDDYVALCSGQSIGRSWTFRIRIDVPALAPVVRLAWAGFRSREMLQALPSNAPPGPALFWSEPNSEGYPPWRLAAPGPGCDELTLVGDRWFVRRANSVTSVSFQEIAEIIAQGILDSLGH